MDANVYLFSMEGKLMNYSNSFEYIILDDYKDVFGGGKLPDTYVNGMKDIKGPLLELDASDTLSLNMEKGADIRNKYTSYFPLYFMDERLGTMITMTYGHKLSEEDLIVAENAANIFSIQIINKIHNDRDEEERNLQIVKVAIKTLSYSDLAASEHIFNEFDGNDCLMIASNIADKVGITRSVIVNALRKFESAGVIKSRSLGMKGTHIQVLNTKLIEELKRRF
ncbi:MAG: GTP-sensing pleiotropic transcriptional regulator CodY [Clostridiaceae bacterium]